MQKKSKRIFIVLIVVVLLPFIFNPRLTSYLFGEVRYQDEQLKPGNLAVPHLRTMAWKKQSPFADSIIHYWADQPILNKGLGGKGIAPRLLLAKLWVKRGIPEVNKAICELKAWGVSGSSWALNKSGDYDFTLSILIDILWYFGDQPDLLYPESKNYLLNVLLTEDGNKFRYTAPRTLGLVMETENHILMTEGSRYLKNRWIMQHGNRDSRYDNLQNGMEKKLFDFMEVMRTNGLYEFNSIPYIGYTITALLNLEAFGSDKLSAEARRVLDLMNWSYALGTYRLRHYPPMRRRYEKSVIQELNTDYQTVFMKSWLSFAPIGDYDRNLGGGEVHALMGALMPYRPADKVVEMIFSKGNGYFVKLGHGSDGSPEIYSAYENSLLSAGGVNRGERSLIVARPITLFRDDRAVTLAETFHLAGPGSNFMKWNNTGVYKNFACAAGPVAVPSTSVSKASNGIWAIYPGIDRSVIAVHSEAALGLLVLFKDIDAVSLLEQLNKANPDISRLKSEFNFPDGRKLTYDVGAPKNKWVMISDNGIPLDRDFDKWPLMDGNLKN